MCLHIMKLLQRLKPNDKARNKMHIDALIRGLQLTETTQESQIILSHHKVTIFIFLAAESDNICCQYLTAYRHWSLNIRSLSS